MLTHAFQSCRLPIGRPLRQALEVLDTSALQLVVVEDASAVVLGTLTDGDIRRALLRGATLDTPVDAFVNRHFTSVGVEAGRAEVLDLMQSRLLAHIPILDRDGRLVGLHGLHEIFGASQRPNWVVIMAGGRGERLRPLTDAVPKPMIRVAGRPILERIVLHLVSFGIRRVFIAVNYLSEMIESHFRDGTTFGCKIEYLRETQPLGTGGALSLLPAASEYPLMVLNGDLLTQFDVEKIFDAHQRTESTVTIGVHQHAYTVPFGVVETDGDRITAMREKPSQSWLTNAGIYVIDPGLVARVPGGVAYSMPDLVEDCLKRGERVGAFRVEPEWTDVGRESELARARGML